MIYVKIHKQNNGNDTSFQIYQPRCHVINFFSLFLLRKGDNKEKDREAVGRQIKSLISNPDSRKKKERNEVCYVASIYSEHLHFCGVVPPVGVSSWEIKFFNV